VNAARRIRLIFFLALAAFSATAKELTDYRIGDKVEADITTPVPLDAPDTIATLAQQAAVMEKTPAVFREFPLTATNQMAVELATVMSVVHGKFRMALQKEFEAPVLDAGKIASPEFTNFVAKFIKTNPRLPLNHALAAAWARGQDGAEATEEFLSRLTSAMDRAVCGDTLPADFFPGENFYAVQVARPDAPVLLEEVETAGRLVDTTNLVTVSRLRANFRRSFTDDEQTLGTALAGFLRANCAPDLTLTETYRKRTAGNSVVMSHFDAGSVIARRGAKIDHKMFAAIVIMREKIAAQRAAPVVTSPAKNTTAIAQPSLEATAAKPNYLGYGISAVAGVIAFYFFIRASRSRRRVPLVTAATAIKSGAPVVFAEVLDQRMTVQPPASVTEILKAAPTPLAPQFVDALKEAVVTELASQRRDMLFAQQAAAAEIADLARRLENAQAPLLERLRAYEERISELESELADQTKQNRELLQLKIEMLKQQIDTERSGVAKNSGTFA
jgi:hypothetical protein